MVLSSHLNSYPKERQQNECWGTGALCACAEYVQVQSRIQPRSLPAQEGSFFNACFHFSADGYVGHARKPAHSFPVYTQPEKM